MRILSRSGNTPDRRGTVGRMEDPKGVIMIIRILKRTVRAVTDRMNAPGRQAGGDFNRELADAEMSQIAGADPPDAPSYGNAGGQESLTPEQRSRLAWALTRRRNRFRD